MKKLLSILFGLFLVLGIAGCNADGSDINIDMQEFIAAPTNLTVSGDELSWDAVNDANGYIVYINGDQVKKVGDDVTTYDFSSDKDGDVLIFQVRTRSPRGMQDSTLSAKIAYVANKQQESLDVKTAFRSEGILVDSEFADELVNKGMVSDDVETMVASYATFKSAMETADTYEDYLLALNALLEDVDNVEALVSGVVHSFLVDYLEDEVGLGYINTEMYQEMLDEINHHPDEMILALTSTVEYVLGVEALITTNYVELIEGLVETEGNVEELNANELYEVKQETVSILKDGMPSQEQMILFVELIDMLKAVTGVGLEDYSSVENYKGKVAAQTLYSIEIFVNMLDSITKTDITDVLGYALDEDLSESMQEAEMQIVLVKVFNRFYDANQNLFDTYSQVFTDEDKAIIYEDTIASLTDIGELNISTTYMSLLASFNVSDLLILEEILDEGFSEVLDELVDSDGEIIRKMTISNGYKRSREYWDDPFVFENVATGETFTAAEYYLSIEVNQFEINQLYASLVNEFVQSIDVNEMNEATDIIITQISETLTVTISTMSGLMYTQAEAEAALEVIDLLFDEANGDMLELVKNLTKFIVDKEVFSQYIEVLEDVDAYMTEEYGVDYITDSGLVVHDDDFKQNAQSIFLAKQYVQFMSNGNRSTLDHILDDIYTAAKHPDFDIVTDYSDSKIDEIEVAVDDFLDLLKTKLNQIDGYNYHRLSENNKTKIEDVMAEILEEAQNLSLMLVSE